MEMRGVLTKLIQQWPL